MSACVIHELQCFLNAAFAASWPRLWTQLQSSLIMLHIRLRHKQASQVHASDSLVW
ncbi:hypothetical protein Mapa_003194 [Marchantia paleacea]|nr:hypothetical protein Mapa_003194 [Marchantia paleacea]